MIKEYIDEINECFQMFRNDFSVNNGYGDYISPNVYDFLTSNLQLHMKRNSRVLADIGKYKEIFHRYLSNSDTIENKELCIAIYINFLIKSGICCFFDREEQEDFKTTKEIIKGSISTKEVYILELVNNISHPMEGCWNEYYSFHPNSIVANIYVFNRLCYLYGLDARRASIEALDVNTYKELWNVYNKLPQEWQEYVIGEGTLSHAEMDFNWLPYISLKTQKDVASEGIFDYYNSLLSFCGAKGTLTSKDVSELLIKKIESFSISEKLDNDSSRDMITFVTLIGNLLTNIHMISAPEKVVPWANTNEIEKPKLLCQLSPEKRNYYLHIPTPVNIRKELFKSHKELFFKNQKIALQEEKKNKMINQYAHSWKHIAYPQIVKEIADQLITVDSSMSCKLMKAYNSELTLKRTIQLLQLSTSDNPRAISAEFRKGITVSGNDTNNNLTVQQVLARSIDLVVFKLLMTESDDSVIIEACREKWKKSLNILREDYSTKFLTQSNQLKKQNIIEWFSENIISITPNIFINEEWESVRFIKDRFAASQFETILVELFTNILLHGENEMSLSFESDDDLLIIKETNQTNNSFSGTHQGISSMRDVVDAINTFPDFPGVITRQSHNTFEIQISFKKSILLRKGWTG